MSRRTKKKIYKSTILFVLLDIIVAACFFIMYGPWPKIRNLYVNTAMKTMSHQYLANVFYSDEQIQEIMASNYFIAIEEDTNTDDVIIDTKEKSSYKDKSYPNSFFVPFTDVFNLSHILESFQTLVLLSLTGLYKLYSKLVVSPASTKDI